MISREDAVAWGLSGPLARASGVKRDLRKDEPYLCYKDNWDGQVKQSRHIIDQLIDDLPGGPMNVVDEGKFALPDKGEVYGSIEGTIQQFSLIMPNRGWDVPIGEAYGCIEGPNGELGFYIVGDGTKVPWRCATRPPSFIHFSRRSLNRLIFEERSDNPGFTDPDAPYTTLRAYQARESSAASRFDREVYDAIRFS